MSITRSREAAKMKPKPLIPAATEAELNEASRCWTEAQDVMVARGFGRVLWGNQRACCHEFVVLMLRAFAPSRDTKTSAPSAPSAVNPSASANA